MRLQMHAGDFEAACAARAILEFMAPAWATTKPSALIDTSAIFEPMRTTTPRSPSSATTTLLPQPRMKARCPAAAHASSTAFNSSAEHGVTNRSAGPPTRNVVCLLIGSSSATFPAPTISEIRCTNSLSIRPFYQTPKMHMHTARTTSPCALAHRSNSPTKRGGTRSEPKHFSPMSNGDRHHCSFGCVLGTVPDTHRYARQFCAAR